MDVVGIDVSKARLDCCMGREKKVFFQVANQERELREAFKKLKGQFPKLFLVVESTGKYHALLYSVATELEVPVAIVNPKRIRDFAKAIGQLAKTDRIDARVIADFAPDWISCNEKSRVCSALGCKTTSSRSYPP
jgi:transposase